MIYGVGMAEALLWKGLDAETTSTNPRRSRDADG
jgi:hypothetical protein